MVGHLARGLPLLALTLALGCDAVDPATDHCAFGEDHVIGTTGGALFDGIDLAMDHDRALAVWSDRAGLFARLVEGHGRPLGDAHRLGPPCDGGVADARSPGGWWVACLRRAVPEKDAPGGVTLFALDDSLALRREHTFGRAGRYSTGVALAPDGDGVWVAWHDGTPGDHVAWLARVGAEQAPGEPWRVSRTGLAAGAPDVVVEDGEPVVAWAETWFGDDGYLVGQVLVSDGRAAPSEVAVIIHEDPRPVLLEDGDGGLLVGWRDEQPAGTHPRLILQRLGTDHRPVGEPQIVGRANGLGRPYLLECEDAITTVAPRTYGHWDVLVGINRMDAHLERLSVERQIYEYGVDFSLAAAACTGDHLLLLAAERGNTAHPRVRIRTGTLDCR